VELAGLGIPEQREQVAAEAGHVGVDDAEDGVGGDGGVDGRAVALEHLEAGLGGGVVGRGDGAASGEDRLAAGPSW
jgi:hypothetical protein